MKTKGFFAESPLFDVFSFSLKEGDAPRALQDPYTIVLTEEMARRYFGGRPYDEIPATLAALETTWETIFPTRPFTYFFLDDDLNRPYRSEQQLSRIFGIFSGMAIVIACLGLLGLIAFTPEQRTKEIGVRKVLGASVPSILPMLTWDFVRPVLIANVLAVPFTCYAMSYWLSSFVYRVDMAATTFVISGLGALVIALLIVGYQAIKTARGNPVEALQYE